MPNNSHRKCSRRLIHTTKAPTRLTPAKIIYLSLSTFGAPQPTQNTRQWWWYLMVQTQRCSSVCDWLRCAVSQSLARFCVQLGVLSSSTLPQAQFMLHVASSISQLHKGPNNRLSDIFILSLLKLITLGLLRHHHFDVSMS